MAKLGFNIEWITRPCMFHQGDCECQNGFWHMWHEEKETIGSIGRSHVVGIVEDERGSVNKVECDNIICLDSVEKFAEYDWELAKKRSLDMRREYERKYWHE